MTLKSFIQTCSECLSEPDALLDTKGRDEKDSSCPQGGHRLAGRDKELQDTMISSKTVKYTFYRAGRTEELTTRGQVGQEKDSVDFESYRMFSMNRSLQAEKRKR